jgi:hypothetical protein
VRATRLPLVFHGMAFGAGRRARVIGAGGHAQKR